jgi:hypothetical protein
VRRTPLALPLHRFKTWWQVADTPLVIRKIAGPDTVRWVVRAHLLGGTAAVPWLHRSGLSSHEFSTLTEAVTAIAQADRFDPVPRLARSRLRRVKAGVHRSPLGYTVLRSPDSTWTIVSDTPRPGRNNRFAGRAATLFQASVAIASLHTADLYVEDAGADVSGCEAAAS